MENVRHSEEARHSRTKPFTYIRTQNFSTMSADMKGKLQCVTSITPA